LAAIPNGDSAEPPEDASAELKYLTRYDRRALADFAKYCKRGAFRITIDAYDE
jgi:hypothetical protein